MQHVTRMFRSMYLCSGVHRKRSVYRLVNSWPPVSARQTLPQLRRAPRHVYLSIYRLQCVAEMRQLIGWSIRTACIRTCHCVACIASDVGPDRLTSRAIPCSRPHMCRQQPNWTQDILRVESRSCILLGLESWHSRRRRCS